MKNMLGGNNSEIQLFWRKHGLRNVGPVNEWSTITTSKGTLLGRPHLPTVSKLLTVQTEYQRRIYHRQERQLPALPSKTNEQPQHKESTVSSQNAIPTTLLVCRVNLHKEFKSSKRIPIKTLFKTTLRVFGWTHSYGRQRVSERLIAQKGQSGIRPLMWWEVAFQVFQLSPFDIKKAASRKYMKRPIG